MDKEKLDLQLFSKAALCTPVRSGVEMMFSAGSGAGSLTSRCAGSGAVSKHTPTLGLGGQRYSPPKQHFNGFSFCFFHM